MLVQKNAPVEYIKSLKVGDLYMDSIITSVKKKERGIMFMTSNGSLYNAHYKTNYYNVFRTDRHKENFLRQHVNKIFKMYGYKKIKLPKDCVKKTPNSPAKPTKKDLSPGPSAPKPERTEL
ncbi:MAG: hypothetical protein LBO04_00690 [Spirochaetaceae bacterium]|jgi:hypothetical protein|nr:hypothetical protein [Spirochaetaceae bacterium]